MPVISEREQQPETVEVERQRQAERRRPRQLDQAARLRTPPASISLPKSTASRAGQAASIPARCGNRLTNQAARIATTNGERMKPITAVMLSDRAQDISKR